MNGVCKKCSLWHSASATSAIRLASVLESELLHREAPPLELPSTSVAAMVQAPIR
jgi:hypothetical protein